MQRGSNLGGSRTRINLTQRSHGSFQNEPIAVANFFLPNGFRVVDFLCDMEAIAQSTPVFARGTFCRLRLKIPVDEHIKPEQVFDHLIQEGHLYGVKVSFDLLLCIQLILDFPFQVFDLGSTNKHSNPLPNHKRFGICEFSDPKPQKLPNKQSTRHFKRQPPNPFFHCHQSTSNRCRGTSATTSSSNISPQNSDDSSGDPPISPAFSDGNMGDLACDLVTEEMSSNYPPYIQLPTVPLFSIACAAFLERGTSKEVKGNNSMNISVFIILTDNRKRFPRARLSSLPQGLPSNAS